MLRAWRMYSSRLSGGFRVCIPRLYIPERGAGDQNPLLVPEPPNDHRTVYSSRLYGGSIPESLIDVYRVCTSSINKGERGKGQCKDNPRGRVLVHPRGPQSIVMPGAIDDRGGSDGRRRVLCGGERSKIPPHTLWAGRPLE